MARDKIFKDTQDFKEQYRALCVSVLGREFDKCTDKERYSMLARLIAAKSRAIEAECHPKEAKKVYYFSLEFLLGPLLDNYLLNYGLRDLVADGIDEMGSSLDTLIKQEVDPGLGNGGLGRLAACFWIPWRMKEWLVLAMVCVTGTACSVKRLKTAAR